MPLLPSIREELVFLTLSHAQEKDHGEKSNGDLLRITLKTDVFLQ